MSPTPPLKEAAALLFCWEAKSVLANSRPNTARQANNDTRRIPTSFSAAFAQRAWGSPAVILS
jgi:hypothetical protein